MPRIAQWISSIREGQWDGRFALLYGKEQVHKQKERYLAALAAYEALYGTDDSVFLFSSPGRTELGGNHTDHNRGAVLAGSVNLDVIAVVSPQQKPEIELHSSAFPTDRVDLRDLEPKAEEKGSSAALIRGVARAFADRGLSFGGFRGYTHSCVPKGSGVSSSAAFEVLLATITDHFYNSGNLAPMEMAKIAQFAEREFFGKPCGLMDQAACAMGGIVMIDFANEACPTVTPIPFRFDESGYQLCLISLGGDHSNLTSLYAAIPQRMKKVAAALGEPALNTVSEKHFYAALPLLRKQCGDEAVLAALHFMQETRRVPEEAAALLENDFPRFLRLVTQSGHSSFEYLQNVLIPLPHFSQDAAIALNLASRLLGERGACRIHGGGFGGTTQNFVPNDLVPLFRKETEAVFGVGSCRVLSIRPVGPVCF